MDSKMDELRAVLLQHWRRYPQMQEADVVKLIFQSEFGVGHFISSEEQAWQRLKEEYTACVRQTGAQVPPLLEDIGGGFCRVNLKALPGSGLTLSTVARWFIQSAPGNSEKGDKLEEKLAVLLELAQQGEIGIPPRELAEFLTQYKEAGCPALHHSAAYRKAYQPAYRVVSKEFTNFAQVFAAIDALLGAQAQVLVAIDGNSGAGKTYLADLLGRIYDCNIFHMDDFFLPSSLKTAVRLDEPGGNVHYERFAAEVLQGLKTRRPFAYGVFDCQAQAITRMVHVEPKPLNIIEGVYSMHPAFGEPYHLKVFLRVKGERQLRRIGRRSGEALLRRFAEEWIPLENRYFEALGILGQADLVYHT